MLPWQKMDSAPSDSRPIQVAYKGETDDATHNVSVGYYIGNDEWLVAVPSDGRKKWRRMVPDLWKPLALPPL